MSIAELVAEAAAPSMEQVGYSSDQCLKCNVCNTVCPVMRVTDKFPGPKYVGPQAARFRSGRTSPVQIKDWPILASPDVTVDYCSGCGWCTAACPAGVKIAEMNSQSRARLRAGHRPKLRDWGLSQTDLVGRVGVLFSPIGNWALSNRLVRWVMETFFGIHRKAPFPKFSRRTYQSVWKRRLKKRDISMAFAGAGSARATSLPGPDKAVVYFHGCAVNYYEPHVANAAISILERNGFQVIVPPQACCGLPAISNGLYADARGKAHKNIEILADYARKGYKILGTSTSCTHTIKAEYREMLDMHDDDTEVVANATWDICEFLLDLHEQGRLDTGFGRLDEDLPYHAPCQLRSHGIGLPAMDLFALVPGLRAQDMDHDCCGIAGTYGMKKEKYDIAQSVGRPLFDKVRASGASEAACDSETCRWQIEKATSVRTKHPVEILAAAYLAGDRARAAGDGAGSAAGSGAATVS
jgi:glycerol-3-phosphate dehydrogenase subunit C